MSSKARIFVDESGDPGLDQKKSRFRPYFVFGYVYSKNPSRLERRLKRLLKKFHDENKYPPELAELKFYLPKDDLREKYGYPYEILKHQYLIHMPEIRKEALSIINDFSDGVFAAILDKRLASNLWTRITLPNFVFIQTLLVNILNVIQTPTPPQVIYDRGRLSPANTRDFYECVQKNEDQMQQRQIKRYHGSVLPMSDTASVSEVGIWAADMVAGSFSNKYNVAESTRCVDEPAYSDIINSKRIGIGERFFWK